jgi:hypothetical protein
MEKTKKELQAEYKERQIVGVFAVKNTLTDKMLIDSTPEVRNGKK